MQINLEQYEKIQNYLDGKMTSGEENDFLAELNGNALLKESFDFEKELRENLISIQDKKDLLEKHSDYFETGRSEEETNSIRSVIERAGKEWEEENKNKISPGISNFIADNKPRPKKAKVLTMKSWVGIAAAACIILAVASLVWFGPKLSSPPPVAKTIDTSSGKENTNTGIVKSPEDSSKNIKPEIKKVDGSASFKKYYAKDMSNQPMPELLAMVPSSYQKGNYSYSETINLENVPNTRGASSDINSKQNILQFGHYYKGLSYIETNEDKRAFENLQWVVDSAQSPQLKIKAQWYLALIYLKLNNPKRALPLLSSLSKNSNEVQYKKHAAEILETLREQEQK